MNYTDFIIQETCKLLSIDSPTGYTDDAIDFVMTELKALGYAPVRTVKGGVIIEEYMVGPEVSVEVIVYEGVPHVLQITDKLTTGAPHFVEMGHSQPSGLPTETQEKIRDLACGRIAALFIHLVQIGHIHPKPMMIATGDRI